MWQVRILQKQRQVLLNSTEASYYAEFYPYITDQCLLSDNELPESWREVTDVPEQIVDQQSAHVFLEVDANTQGHSLHVQQQIPYTVRLYYDD